MILTKQSPPSPKTTPAVSFPLRWREPSGDNNFKGERRKGKQKRPSKQSKYSDLSLPRIRIRFVLHVFINMGSGPHLCRKGQILVWIILKCRRERHPHISGGTSQPKKAWTHYSFTHHVYTGVENHYSLGDTNISCLFNLATEHAFPPHRLQFWKTEWIPLKYEMLKSKKITSGPDS